MKWIQRANWGWGGVAFKSYQVSVETWSLGRMWRISARCYELTHPRQEESPSLEMPHTGDSEVKRPFWLSRAAACSLMETRKGSLHKGEGGDFIIPEEAVGKILKGRIMEFVPVKLVI